MVKSLNDEPFAVALQILEEVVVETASRTAGEFRLQVQKFMQEYLKQFYIKMFERLDTTYSNLYDGLNDHYADRKARLGRNLPDFYRFTGQTETYLKGLEPVRQFGAIKVKFIKTGREQSNLVKIDSAGRAQYRSGGAARGFASDSVAFTALVFTLEIQAFQKDLGKTPRDVLQRYAGTPQGLRFIGTNLGRKGGVRGGRKITKQPSRPLLKPFLEWYGTTNLKSVVNQKFKVQV
jgi:hypothetical protein